MNYPETRVEDAQDSLAGVHFPDPYRWLEQQSEDVKQWQRAQAKLAGAHVSGWPQLGRLRDLVSRFRIGGQHGDQYRVLPRYAAGQWFRTRLIEGASQEQALVANDPMGEGRVLFDPRAENPERPSFLSWIAPSPDGQTLAIGICSDGSENNTIRLIDVATGRTLADPPQQILMDCWTGGVQWLPDSSGFFFSAITGAAVNFEQQVYLHRRDPAPNTTLVDIAWTRIQATDYRWVVVSGDGKHAVALQNLIHPIPVAVAVLGDQPLTWRPFVTSFAGQLAGHVMGNRYIAVTYFRAPRGRVVSIPLDTDSPDDPANWQELVSESDAVMMSLTPVGGSLYLTELIDTFARVRIVNLEGKVLGEVPLPGRGALGSAWMLHTHSTLPKGHPDKFLFTFSSPTASQGIYCHTRGQRTLETLQSPQAQIENAVVEDRYAVSVDGTRVPYHLVRRSDVSAHQPQPTLIYVYGGYGFPFVPQFPGAMAAFIAAGGVFVYAHVRGGGELGLEWWQGGKMATKQNTLNDLYAVAEDLIATNRSAPQLLALTGRSNGGLIAGLALTQRPDLWKVVIPQVPLADLIGGCRDPYGRMAIVIEYASDESVSESRRLSTLSPYHLVREGVRYPAVFLPAGDTDPRCPPWHARKLAARLQRASSSDAPILLHVWENVGHGSATDKAIAVTDYTEWLAFTLCQLGIHDWE